MSLNVIYGGLELGFIYGLMALGLYISFRVMNIPDLTTDGSFTLGLAVSAVVANENHSVLGIILAFLAGACAGFVTGFLQTKMRIHPVVSGIISMCGLYSINLIILGSPNVNIPKNNRIFTSVDKTRCKADFVLPCGCPCFNNYGVVFQDSLRTLYEGNRKQ